jgi:selenocysteine lyase/cysteine desulfurase
MPEQREPRSHDAVAGQAGTVVFDLARARRETPGCEQVLHFNNAGASLMPQVVLDTMIAHLELEARIGGYESADRVQDRLNGVYASAARLLGCDSDEIAIVENATRAWDMAFYAIPLGPGDRILTANAEYGSNYIAFLQRARQTGAVVEAIPNDEHGQLSIAALERMMDERVEVVAITHVPTNGGLVNPAAAVGKVAREAGALYLLDACQSVGQMDVNVSAIGCDMLSATGRKYLRGPRGIGFLYVRREVVDRLEPPLLDLHAAEWVAADRFVIRPGAKRFENWESNVAAKLGLGAAIDYALGWGLDTIRARVTALATLLRARLSDIAGVSVHDLGVERCGIVSLTLEGHEPDAVRAALARERINVTVSRASATRLDMDARHLPAVVRASVHYYNSEEEVDRFCAAVGALAAAHD